MLKRVLIVICLCCVAISATAKEIQAKDDQGRDYWLYVPDTIDPAKPYTLVVGVHGYRGKVHQIYVDSLETDISRIDRMAEREVRKIVRDHGDPQQRRAALEKHKADFVGAPKTAKAVDTALEELS